MVSVRVRVPVKATLFGEHAVVYQKPAIAATLPLHIRVEVKPLDRKVIVIESRGINVPLRKAVYDRASEVVNGEVDSDIVKKVISYVIKAIEVCEESSEAKFKGYSVAIESSLPVGVGLGTSAAISVGTVTACLVLNGAVSVLSNDVRRLIAYLAWQTEKRVQGAASPMDTHTVTFGGLLYIKPWIPSVEPIEPKCKFPLIVGYTHKAYTTAELVSHVKDLYTKHSRVVELIMDLIAVVVEEARKCIEQCRLDELGELMNINHGLLSALGVVSPQTDTIVHALRRAGALGAKMSGAGGGGAFLALAKTEKDAEMLSSVAKSLGATVVAQSIHMGGVDIELEPMM